MYPGVITVGEDGVLRLEIGGSENYILSCLNSSVEIPEPGEPETEATGEAPATDPTEGEQSVDATEGEETQPTETVPAEEEEGTVAGIPVMHIALFGGGLIVAIGALVGINFYQKRSGKSNKSEEDDDEI